MAQRGGYIPSGSSPLFLGDFATPMNAVSQRMIGTMLDRQAQKQEQQSKSQKALLEALDFSAIEGLSDQVSQELLDKQNAIEDKWSQQYLENDMVLSDQQRFELRKDMREYERYAAKLKYNVAQAAYVQKELASPNAPEKYDLSSWDKWMDFQKSGGKGDASQILIPAYNVNSMVDDLTADWDSKELYNEKTVADYEKGIETVTRTNVEALNDRMTRVLQDPNVQRMLNHPQYGPKLKAGLARRYEDLKVESKDEDVISPQTLIAEQKRQATSNLPKETKEKLQKYPQWQNVKPEEIPNVEYFNDFAERVLRQDADALEQLKQKNLTNFGIPEEIVVNPDGSTTLYNKKGDPYEIPATDWGDADNVIQSKTNVMNLIPDRMEGKQIPDNMQSWLVPDYEVDVKKKAPITAVQNVRDALEASEGDLKPEEREKVIQNLKIVFPESEFDVKKNYSPLEKRRKIKWDGEEYDLITEEGRNKLFDEINNRLGRGGGEQPEGRTFTDAQEREIQKAMEQNPGATREDIITAIYGEEE